MATDQRSSQEGHLYKLGALGSGPERQVDLFPHLPSRLIESPCGGGGGFVVFLDPGLDLWGSCGICDRRSDRLGQ